MQGRFLLVPVGLLLAAVGALAQTTPEPLAPPTAASAPQAKVAPLLGLVLNHMFNKGVESMTGHTVGGLFDRLWQRMRQGGATPEGVADAGPTAPAVGYVIQQLEPGSLAVRRHLTLGIGEPVLSTGDIFALQYSTSLPGLVRLENVDGEGRVAHLGTYVVHADQLNRLPADQGIRLEGKPGLEVLRMYFHPCLPPATAARPATTSVAAVTVGLPACLRPGGGAPATEVAALGTLRPRAMVNLSQPEPTMAFVGSDGFRAGDVLLTEVRIRHEAVRP